MKTIVASILAVLCLLGVGPVVAQEATGFGLLEGVVGRPEPAPLPRRDEAPAAPPPSQAAKTERPAMRGNPLAAISLDALRQTRERPLFSQSRRPPVVAELEPPRIAEPLPEPEPAVEEPPSLTLVGTVVGTDRDVAVFFDTAARQIVRLRIGDAEAGWTLRRVDPKTTMLEKDRREVTLSLPPPIAASGSDDEGAAGIDAVLQPTFGEAPSNFQAPRATPGQGQRPVPFQSRVPSSGPVPERPQIGHEF